MLAQSDERSGFPVGFHVWQYRLAMSSASTSRRGRLWLWLIVGAIALLGVAWGAVAILFPPARVRSIVQAQLGQALSREVRFADASVGLFPPIRLTVKAPELAEPGGFTRGAAFRADALHLDLDVFALLGRRIVVRRLVVTRPTLHLVMRPDGTTNLDDIGKKPTEAGPAGGAPMDLELKALDIEQGRMLLDDLKGQKRTTLALGSHLALRSQQAGTRIATTGTTEITDVAFGPLSAAKLSDLDHSLANLKWKIEHDGAFDAKQNRLALQRLTLAFGKTEMALSGIVDQPGPKARLDLRAKGSQLDLGEVLAFVAVADAKAVKGIRGSGRLDFDLAVRGGIGPGQKPDLTGTLAIADGAFRYSGAPAGVEALSLVARLAPDEVQVGRLSARVIGSDGRPLAPLTGSLSVRQFADPRLTFALNGPVNLAAVAPLVAPQNTKLAGTAVIDLRGQGLAKDPGSFALEGKANLANVSVEAPDLPKKVEKIQAEIQFSPSHAAVRRFTMQAGKSSVGLDATVARPLALMGELGKVEPAEVDFDLRSPYLDLAELLPVTPGSPVLPNARGHGRVTIGRLKKEKLDISSLNAQLDLTPACCRQARTRSTVMGAS